MTGPKAAPAQGYRHIFLDFDGPVCTVFGDLSAVKVAHQLWRQTGLSGDVPPVAHSDPVALLRLVAQDRRVDLTAVERDLRHLETTAVATAPITPGLVDALEAFATRGQSVTIVSNNSAHAVRAFLARHALCPYITAICSRERPDPDLLKPSPFLLLRAMNQLGAAAHECVIIGDSTTDLQAAEAAGTGAIAYANKADKVARFLPFTPDAIVDHMSKFVGALAPRD